MRFRGWLTEAKLTPAQPSAVCLVTRLVVQSLTSQPIAKNIRGALKMPCPCGQVTMFMQ